MFILTQFGVKHINSSIHFNARTSTRDDKIGRPVIEFHPELFYYLGLIFIAKQYFTHIINTRSTYSIGIHYNILLNYSQINILYADTFSTILRPAADANLFYSHQSHASGSGLRPALKS